MTKEDESSFLYLDAYWSFFCEIVQIFVGDEFRISVVDCYTSVEGIKLLFQCGSKCPGLRVVKEDRLYICFENSDLVTNAEPFRLEVFLALLDGVPYF